MKKFLKELKEKHEYYKSRDEVAPYIQVGVWAIMLIPSGFYVIDLVDYNYNIEGKIIIVTLLLGVSLSLIEKLCEKFIINENSQWCTKFVIRNIIGTAGLTCFCLAFGTFIGW